MAKKTADTVNESVNETASEAKPVRKKTPRTQKERATEVPLIRDENGDLVKGLGERDFPLTRDGRIAFADYQIAKWTARRAEAENWQDPTEKLEDQICKRREKLEALEKKLAELQSAKQ